VVTVGAHRFALVQAAFDQLTFAETVRHKSFIFEAGWLRVGGVRAAPWRPALCRSPAWPAPS